MRTRAHTHTHTHHVRAGTLSHACKWGTLRHARKCGYGEPEGAALTWRRRAGGWGRKRVKAHGSGHCQIRPWLLRLLLLQLRLQVVGVCSQPCLRPNRSCTARLGTLVRLRHAVVSQGRREVLRLCSRPGLRKRCCMRYSWLWYRWVLHSRLLYRWVLHS